MNQQSLMGLGKILLIKHMMVQYTDTTVFRHDRIRMPRCY